MMDLVRIELFKFRTQRALLVILVLGLALGILGNAFLFIALRFDATANIQLGSASMQRQFLTAAGTSLVAVVLAVLGVTSEFRHGTITSTIRAVPARHRFVLGKALTYALIALVYGLVAAGLNQVGARGVLASEGIDLVVSGSEVLRGVAKNIVALILFALIGAGVAIAVANQVAALLIVLLENFVSGIVTLFIPRVGKYLPSQAIAAFTSERRFAADSLSPEAGVAVFACYAVAAIAAGTVMLARRDIG